MRVAFIGTRGVPAAYSGFETFVEQLGCRLAHRGHDVTVYCRRHHVRSRESSYLGMRLLHVGGIATKHLDTITHTSMSIGHALTQRYDVVVMCISGNSPLAIVPRMAGAKVVLNVDGSDWRRRKWGSLARAYIRASEWVATRAPNVTVTDSEVMQRYYLDRLGAVTECIAYGAELPEPTRSGKLQELGLRSRGYFLLVGRLVPENCAHHLVQAYERLLPPLRCVIVGDAPYAESYIKELKRAGRHVDFPGYVFGDGYRELMHNAYATVLCSEVGGTHPVLVEAMSAGNCVVVNDTPANLEVVGDAGMPYSGTRGADGLYDVLRSLVEQPNIVDEYRWRACARASQCYSWEAVTDRYEDLFRRLLGQAEETRVVTAGTE
ncbi:MAG: DUF1972 domain-containing protein [Chloroflexota bacterium]